MAATSRRGMDWPTAWSALLPVYGLAILLDAFYPLFALPVWIIFLFYAMKVLDGARTAENPWRGRATPRRYLLPFIAGLVVQDVSFAGLSPGSGALSAILGTLVALGSATLFVLATAPPGVRDERPWLGLGAGAEILGAFLFPLPAFVPLGSAETTATVVSLGRLGLALVSVGGFLLASRAAARRAPVMARKTPRA